MFQPGGNVNISINVFENVSFFCVSMAHALGLVWLTNQH